MLSLVTNVNETHDLLTVPVGLIDDFARDDGWPGDRPASCGNFWVDAGLVPYLAGGYFTQIPGISGWAGWLYLGTGEQVIQVDVTAPTSGSGYWLVRLLGDPANNSNIQLEVGDHDSFITNENPPGTFTNYASSSYAYTPGATDRWYFHCRPESGQTRFIVYRSTTSGTGMTLMFSGTITATPTGSWLLLGGIGNNTKFANLQRIAPFAFIDDFNRANGAPGSPYVTEQGTFAVSSNQLVATAATGTITIPSTVQVQTIAGDFTYGGGSQTLALNLRTSDRNNTYQMTDGNGGCALYQVVGGSVVATVATGTGLSGTSGHHEFSMVGSTYTYSRNGSVVLTGTTSNVTLDGNTKAGLILTSTAQAVDNLVLSPYAP